MPCDVRTATDMNQSVDSDTWSEDALGRSSMAEKLTNVVAHEHSGTVLSLNGAWGTGKTFFLTRWQRHLEQEGFRSLYFNAWQDEFCDEPFVSILSHLNAFSKDGNLASIGQKYQTYLSSLLLHNVESIMKSQFGVKLKIETGQRIQLYQEKIDLKKQLKEELGKIANRIHEESTKPLIFIVDELDRCRPTYSVDFLEKIVHIFQVPNIVFVFGINKGELLKSLQSIYGAIDSKVYLRRFFQKEYIMPLSDPTAFCNHLVVSTGLSGAFAKLGQTQADNLSDFVTSFSAVAGKWKLSLRDIEYCFRAIEFTAKNLSERSVIHPCFLAVLIPLSLVKHSLYRRLVEGELVGADVANFLDKFRDKTGSQPMLNASFDLAEIYLYSTYSSQAMNHNPAFKQLSLLAEGRPLTNPSVLSDQTQKSTPERAQKLLDDAHELLYSYHRNPEALSVVSSLIELVDR